ncbi:MAG TPA: YfhL family 4Fe-4S dicluster ferredoxin [Polyangiaceae bacterium]|nr:YfhL family 4Fe-4S dicluster ferredoxin [Polyangiaceae bacterium]
MIRPRQVPSMALLIGPECIQCAACAPECPNDAIRADQDSFVIDPSLCTECVAFYDQPRCLSLCPVECCLPDPDRAETEDVLAARAIELHPDDDELKARIDANDFPSRFRR